MFGQGLLLSSGALAEYVGGSSGNTLTITFPIGTVAGDFALIFTLDPSVTIGGGSGGWSSYAGSWFHTGYTVHWKVLTATDISAAAASTLTRSNSTWDGHIVVYRGPVSGSVRSVASTGPTGAASLGLSGFVPSDDTVGIVAVCVERDSVNPVVPTDFTSRLLSSASANFRLRTCDWLLDYYAGGNITFTGLSATQGEMAFAFELVAA